MSETRLNSLVLYYGSNSVCMSACVKLYVRVRARVGVKTSLTEV